MKKRTVVLISLVFALLLMGSAYALWVDKVDITVTASTGSMDIRIVSASASVNSSLSQPITDAEGTPVTAEVNSTTEVIENFAQGETVTFTYGIENHGTVPVHLSGVNLTIDTSNAYLEQLINVEWTITDDDGTVVGNGGKSLSAEAASTYTFDLGDGVTINGNPSDMDYCTLEMILSLSEASTTPKASIQTVEFTLYPIYTQNG